MAVGSQPEKTFVVVCRTTDIADGKMRDFKIGNREILIVRSGDRYFATESFCPHMGTRLSGGKIDSTIITCPEHGSRFDLIDGRIIRWTDWTVIRADAGRLFRAPHPLTVYEVRVVGDEILVKL